MPSPNAPFGNLMGGTLYDISTALLTFSERIEDDGSVERIHRMVSEAGQLVFLGFAFHDANLKLLKNNRTKKCKPGDRYGI